MNSRETIGILFPGEMGVAVARRLDSRGVRVVSTLAGRGARTADRAREAGIVILDSLADVARESNVVISLVPPAAAVEVAQSYCDARATARHDSLFVDANSISPETAATVARILDRAGIGMVDAAINGLAKNLASTATLFLSGERAQVVSDLFGDAMRVQRLGPTPGRAKAMKMLLSGLSKGVCALFVETALMAHRQGMLKEMTDAYSAIYPGVMGIVDRMLPTYPDHATRRADEMRELCAAAAAAGLAPPVIAAIGRVHELLAQTDLSTSSQGPFTVATLIERLAAQGLLSTDSPQLIAAVGA